MLEYLSKDLVEITKDCRDDMHEPDNQGLSATMTGYLFDNAMGDDPMGNFGEMTIGLTRNGETKWFNLASLIALAKQGALLQLTLSGK